MQLAACGCAAMANTDETSPRARDISDEYKSASWGDVCRAVDREMEQRAEIEALRAEVEFWKSAAEEHHRKIRDEVERLRNRDHEAQLPGGHDKTLCGPLCPYCEVERLREELKAKEDKP